MSLYEDDAGVWRYDSDGAAAAQDPIPGNVLLNHLSPDCVLPKIIKNFTPFPHNSPLPLGRQRRAPRSTTPTWSSTSAKTGSGSPASSAKELVGVANPPICAVMADNVS